jgi:hypothetical protein
MSESLSVKKNFGDTICVIKVNRRMTDNIIAQKDRQYNTNVAQKKKNKTNID